MKYFNSFALFLAVFFSVSQVWAIDLSGSQTSDESVVASTTGSSTSKVSIEGQPLTVQQNRHTEVREIASEVQLNKGETFESDYIDVKEFRHATFYVLEKNDNSIKVVSTPQGPIRYELNAFFTVDANTTKVMAMGDDKPKIVNKGIQEFGSQISKTEGDVQYSFEKLSTGETSTRALHTKIYGPYVRLVLKSLSSKEQQRYRIVAYFTD